MSEPLYRRLAAFLMPAQIVDLTAFALAVPALFAVAPGDRYVTVKDMRRVYQASSAKPKRLVVLPEPLGHGWAMLDDNGLTAFGALMVATNVFNNALRVDLDEYLEPYRRPPGGSRSEAVAPRSTGSSR